MKTTIRIAALAAFLALAGAAQAETAAGDFALSGTFTASCSFQNAAFSVGDVPLHLYVKSPGSFDAYTRIPVTIDVQCNSDSVPWKIYNTGGGPVNVTIGSVADNLACIASEASDNISVCATSSSSGSWLIDGVGTMTKNAVVALHHQGPKGRTPYQGHGAIVGSIPLTLEF